MERTVTHVLFPAINTEELHELGPNFTFSALSTWQESLGHPELVPQPTTVVDPETDSTVSVSSRLDLGGLRLVTRFALPQVVDAPPDRVTVLARREMVMIDDRVEYTDHDWFVGSTLAWKPVGNNAFDLIARHNSVLYRPYGEHIEEPTVIRVSGPNVDPADTTNVEAAVIQIGRLIGNGLEDLAA